MFERLPVLFDKSVRVLSADEIGDLYGVNGSPLQHFVESTSCFVLRVEYVQNRNIYCLWIP